jgi:hypothetical protein
MNCQETRQKLSMYADNALRDEERRSIEGHLIDCPSCRQELDEQGALDMLLKSAFSVEPPPEFLEALWPSVSEGIDGEAPGDEKPPNGGGKAREEGEILFRSSSAMQILSIPEPKVAPVAAASPTIMPAEPAHPWRWPVAFIVATVVVVGGFLVYKKTMGPEVQQASGPGAAGPSTIASQGAGPTPDAAMKVAMVTPLEAGASSTPSDPDETTASGAAGNAPTEERTKGHPGAKARRARGKGVKGSEAADVSNVSEAKTEPKPAAAKEAPPRPRAGKKDDLDNLIDTAIGSGNVAAPKAKKAAPAAAPASDVPDQLTMPQIQASMGKIKGFVQSCYDQFQVEGMAKVTFTISNEGAVKEATIKGKFFGTDTGTCVINAVKKAHFPKFSGKPMTISGYPFLLQ